MSTTAGMTRITGAKRVDRNPVVQQARQHGTQAHQLDGYTLTLSITSGRRWWASNEASMV
jgi:hypothetical protein